MKTDEGEIMQHNTNTDPLPHLSRWPHRLGTQVVECQLSCGHADTFDWHLASVTWQLCHLCHWVLWLKRGRQVEKYFTS